MQGTVDLNRGTTRLTVYFNEVDISPVPDASITFDVFACPGQDMTTFDANACNPYDFATWPIIDDNMIFSSPGTITQSRIGWWSPPTTSRNGNTAVVMDLNSRSYTFQFSNLAQGDLPQSDAFAGFIMIPAGAEQFLENDVLSRSEKDPLLGVLKVDVSQDNPQHYHYRVYVLHEGD